MLSGRTSLDKGLRVHGNPWGVDPAARRAWPAVPVSFCLPLLYGASGPRGIHSLTLEPCLQKLPGCNKPAPCSTMPLSPALCLSREALRGLCSYPCPHLATPLPNASFLWLQGSLPTASSLSPVTLERSHLTTYSLPTWWLSCSLL